MTELATASSLVAAAAETLREMARTFGVPGLCVALVAPGRTATLLHGEDWGGSGRAVGRDSWFQAASAGKHVTACAILELAAQGRIDLAAPIGHYLTELPRSWAKRSVGSLLHHSSGLPDYLADGGDEPVPVTRAGFVQRYASLEPIADERAAWSYSNTNYILLGFLAAEVAGRPCGVVIQDMLARLGVSGATVASPDWVRHANATQAGCDARDEDSLAREVIGDGDLAFTGEGAAAWLRVLIEDGMLSASARVELFRPGSLAAGSAPYGCGLFLEPLHGATLAHHGGHFDGWTAMLLVDRDARSGVFALCNLAPGNTRAIRAIAQRALEEFAPGSTPLSLEPVPDRAPAFTATVRRQLLRAAWPPDRDCFAPALQTAIDRAGARGLPNLWAGEEPLGFALVGEQEGQGRVWRRYRLTYAARTEHLSIGMTADGRIDWAWPL